MSDDLDFHYNREERLAMRSAPKASGSGRGLLRGRKRPLVLLINLVLMVALFMIYARTQGPAHTAEVLGWQVTLRGMAAGSDVLAVLEATAGAGADRARQSGEERLFVVFRAGEAEMRLSEVLPARPAQGDSIVVSGRLVEAGRPRDLSAEVSIGDRTTTLRRSLDRD